MAVVGVGVGSVARSGVGASGTEEERRVRSGRRRKEAAEHHYPPPSDSHWFRSHTKKFLPRTKNAVLGEVTNSEQK